MDKCGKLHCYFLQNFFIRSLVLIAVDTRLKNVPLKVIAGI